MTHSVAFVAPMTPRFDRAKAATATKMPRAQRAVAASWDPKYLSVAIPKAMVKGNQMISHPATTATVPGRDSPRVQAKRQDPWPQLSGRR